MNGIYKIHAIIIGKSIHIYKFNKDNKGKKQLQNIIPVLSNTVENSVQAALPKISNFQTTLNALISHINFSMFNIFVLFLRSYFPYVFTIMNNFILGWILNLYSGVDFKLTFQNDVVVSSMIWEAILEIP